MLEVYNINNRGLCGCHDRPNCTRQRIKHDIVAKRALTGDPQPIRQHQIYGSRPERHFSRFCRCELKGFDRKVELTVKSMRLDNIEFPGKRAGFLHCEPNTLGGMHVCDSKHTDKDQCRSECSSHRETMPYPRYLLHTHVACRRVKVARQELPQSGTLPVC